MATTPSSSALERWTAGGVATFIHDEVQASTSSCSSSSSSPRKSDFARDVASKEMGRGRGTRRKRKGSLEGGYHGGVADGVEVKDFAAMKLGIEEGEEGEGETCGGEGKMTTREKEGAFVES